MSRGERLETGGEHEQLPPSLVRDLAELDRAGPVVPAALDRAIVSLFEQRVQSTRRVRTALRWTVGAAAAAAVVVVGLHLWDIAGSTGVNRETTAFREDLNRDGAVDILDAYLLARRIESDVPTKSEWDMDVDGQVGVRDVEVVALAAVRVERRILQ